DQDLARLYGVTTKRLNEQVKRNRSRFPKDFLFQLTAQEKEQVVANCGYLAKLKFPPGHPYAFTEHGALMAANVLKSQWAVKMNLYIIRAFVKLREVFNLNQILEGRLNEIERILLDHDSALRDLYEKIKLLLLPPATVDAIGFDIGIPRLGKIG
ncbi:MAG: hypothetical protein COW12_02600, partial [Candidatus Omnitrophica bacterium CG12_big_fil_rev_8_21_14_0_65_45_16]